MVVTLNETVVLVAADAMEIKFVERSALLINVAIDKYIERFTAQLLLVPRQIPV